MASEERQYIAWLRWVNKPVPGRDLRPGQKLTESGDNIYPFSAKDDDDARRIANNACTKSDGGRGNPDYHLLKIWEVAREVPREVAEDTTKRYTWANNERQVIVSREVPTALWTAASEAMDNLEKGAVYRRVIERLFTNGNEPTSFSVLSDNFGLNYNQMQAMRAQLRKKGLLITIEQVGRGHLSNISFRMAVVAPPK